MLNHRKPPGRSGRRSVKGGAMFAALALAFSASAFFGTGAASAGDQTCNDVPSGISANYVHYCYTVTTNLDGAHIPLGDPVVDTATVTQNVVAPVVTCDNELSCTPPVKTGSVTFDFFTGSGCSSALTSDTQPLAIFPDPTSSVNSSDQSPLAAGTYSVLATFNGSVTVTFDQEPHTYTFSATGTCENFTVDPVHPAVDTQISIDSSGTNGTFVHDHATVSGVDGILPTGQVSFTFFRNGSCTYDGSQTGAGVYVLTSGSALSGSVGALNAGSYSFLAQYEGDSNYLATAGPCEPLVVNTTIQTVTQTVVQPQPVLQPVLQPVIVVQPAAPQQVVEVSPASAVRATGSFTG